jgi:hypothetical protein
LELKTVDEFAPVHLAQILSQAAQERILINFNKTLLKDGIKSVSDLIPVLPVVTIGFLQLVSIDIRLVDEMIMIDHSGHGGSADLKGLRPTSHGLGIDLCYERSSKLGARVV